MRKLIRAKLMHDAKQYKGKTIRVFHFLWKKEVVDNRKAIITTGTKKLCRGKQVVKPIVKKVVTKDGKAVEKQSKKKSMLRRTVEKLMGGFKRG